MGTRIDDIPLVVGEGCSGDESLFKVDGPGEGVGVQAVAGVGDYAEVVHSGEIIDIELSGISDEELIVGTDDGILGFQIVGSIEVFIGIDDLEEFLAPGSVDAFEDCQIGVVVDFIRVPTDDLFGDSYEDVPVVSDLFVEVESIKDDGDDGTNAIIDGRGEPSGPAPLGCTRDDEVIDLNCASGL